MAFCILLFRASQWILTRWAPFSYRLCQKFPFLSPSFSTSVAARKGTVEKSVILVPFLLIFSTLISAFLLFTSPIPILWLYLARHFLKKQTQSPLRHRLTLQAQTCSEGPRMPMFDLWPHRAPPTLTSSPGSAELEQTPCSLAPSFSTLTFLVLPWGPLHYRQQFLTLLKEIHPRRPQLDLDNWIWSEIEKKETLWRWSSMKPFSVIWNLLAIMNSMVPFKLVMCEYHTVWTKEWSSLSERVIFFDPAGSLSAKCGKLNQLW